MKIYKFNVVYAVKDEDNFSFKDMLLEIDEESVLPEEVRELNDLPEGWDPVAIPFGDSDLKSISLLLTGGSETISVNGKLYKRIN